MEQSDYHTSYATASDLLSNPDLPVAIVVACHVIAGTSVLGQRAIDHFYEAQRNAVLYMSLKDFDAFKEFTKILVNGAFKEGGEEDDGTTKAEVEEREENKETYAEKLKAKAVVEVRIPRSARDLEQVLMRNAGLRDQGDQGRREQGIAEDLRMILEE